MPTYVYETVPGAGQPSRRIEVVQRMADAPLTADPASGEPIRRVVSGGLGYLGPADGPAAVGAACQPGCACHSGSGRQPGWNR